MTINTALEQLLEVESIRQGDGMYISITVGNFRSLLLASPYYLQAISHWNLNADTECVALLCVYACTRSMVHVCLHVPRCGVMHCIVSCYISELKI